MCAAAVGCCAGMVLAAPATGPGGGKLPLVFWAPGDVADTFGKIRFGAEPLRREGQATGFPGMQYGCEAPRDDGRTWIYGWRIQNWGDRAKRTLEVVRCVTADGKTFTDTGTVFSFVNKDWQGFANIVRRPTDGMLFLFSWAPGALHVFSSQTGKDWRLLTDKAYSDHDAMCVTWHDGLGKFINYQHTLEPYEKRYPDNIGKLRRVMSFRESTDGVTWTPLSPAFLGGERMWKPDADDPADLEFYRCVVFPHQGRYAMLLCDYMPHPPAANPRRSTTKHSSRYLTEWAIGPDGINWERPFRETDAVEKTIWMPLQGPLIRGGVLRFYLPGGEIASLPDDRIFYVTCRANGEFSTPPFRMPAGGLVLNAAARYRPAERPGQAYIMAALCDRNGRVIEGFDRDACLFEDRDGRALPMRWDDEDGSAHKGRGVRLRFYLRDAKVYGIAAHGPERTPTD